jgi:hypothetical protein
MKNCICLTSVCLLILFAGAILLAQQPSPLPTPPGTMVPCKLCPITSVSCPSDLEVGKPVEFKSTIIGADPEAKLTYTWEVAGGELAEGQGTTAIKVNVTRSPGPTVGAYLRVGGLDPMCDTTASCSITNCGMPPSPMKFNSYGVVSPKQERARLDIFREALKQNPGGQGYIFGYGGRRSREDEAPKQLSARKDTWSTSSVWTKRESLHWREDSGKSERLSCG